MLHKMLRFVCLKILIAIQNCLAYSIIRLGLGFMKRCCFRAALISSKYSCGILVCALCILSPEILHFPGESKERAVVLAASWLIKPSLSHSKNLFLHLHYLHAKDIFNSLNVSKLIFESCCCCFCSRVVNNYFYKKF